MRSPLPACLRKMVMFAAITDEITERMAGWRMTVKHYCMSRTCKYGEQCCYDYNNKDDFTANYEFVTSMYMHRIQLKRFKCYQL